MPQVQVVLWLRWRSPEGQSNKQHGALLCSMDLVHFSNLTLRATLPKNSFLCESIFPTSRSLLRSRTVSHVSHALFPQHLHNSWYLSLKLTMLPVKGLFKVCYPLHLVDSGIKYKIQNCGLRQRILAVERASLIT